MKRNNKTVIGFTGGVGSGKSTVLSEIVKQYDVHLIAADEVGRKLMEKGRILYRMLIKRYGTAILDVSEEIHKGKLAEIAFQTKESQAEINAIEHPVIRRSIETGIRNTKKQFVLVEAALLKEGGLTEICDLVLSVITDPEIRIKRLMESRGYSEEKCRAIIDKQKTNAEFREMSTKVFENNGELSETLGAVFSYLDALGVPKKR